jgi:O-antigen/teichoic acid export membrane protein
MRLLSIAVTAVVAHILDPRDFGVFAVALTAYAIVSSIGQLGVSACLLRADLDMDFLAPTVVTISWATSAILAAVMVLYARPIAAALGSAAGAEPVRAMAIAVFLAGIFAVPCTQLVRDFKLDKQFLANVVSFVPTTATLFFLAKSGSGAMAFAWSRVIGQLIEGLVVIAYVPKNYWPGLRRSTLPMLFKFGLPLAGANFVNYILLNIDYAFVGHLLGAVALGTYVLAFNVASWPASLLGGMISNVSMPAFSRVKHDPDVLKVAIARALRAISLVVMPICGLTMAVARPLILTLYGAQWIGSAKVLSVLSVYGAISIICVLFSNIIATMGQTRLLLVTQLVWISTLIPAMTLGVHKNGISGAAVAHIAVIGPIVLPTYLLALRRTTGVCFGALIRAVMPALLAAAVAILAARVTISHLHNPLEQLIAGLAAGGLVYAVTVVPYAAALLNRGQAEKLRPVLRIYHTVARFMGLHVGNRPKHSARGNTWRAPQRPKHSERLGGLEPSLSKLIAEPPSYVAQMTGLAMLMALARPEPVEAVGMAAVSADRG